MRKKNSASAERKSWEVNEVGISDGKEHTKVERECQRDESVKGSEGGGGENLRVMLGRFTYRTTGTINS